MNETDPTLLELLRDEIGVQLEVLQPALLALEQDPSAVSAQAECFRAAHSLKGAARIVGLDVVVRLAHAMEDILSDARAGSLLISSEMIDHMLAASDIFARLALVDATMIEGWLASEAVVIDATARGLAAAREGRSTSRASVVASSPPLPIALDTGRAVRVDAELIRNLVSLASDTLVETRRLEPLPPLLVRLRIRQSRLARALDRLARTKDADPELHAIATEAAILVKTLDRVAGEADATIPRATRRAEQIQHAILSSRLRPFGEGVLSLQRLVRDIGRDLGKEVRLEIEGNATRIDRDVLEALDTPLGHLLRNAIDHGIESPPIRTAAGKPALGTVRLAAWHRRGRLLITVSDDGAGIDEEDLRGEILARGLAPIDTVAALKGGELFDYLLLPGFSTAPEVTEISGRGVGLDAVQTMVASQGGLLRIQSRVGHGTSFELELPLSRSLLRALVVRIDGEPFAIPLARVDRVLRVSGQLLAQKEGKTLALNGVPGAADGTLFVRGADVLGFGFGEPGVLPESPNESPGGSSDVVLLSHDGSRIALAVGVLVGEKDLAVRPLDKRLGAVPCVQSVALLEDGSPVLILDPDDLVRLARQQLGAGRVQPSNKMASETSSADENMRQILVVDDSPTVRAHLSRVLDTAGYRVEEAVDGRDGLVALLLGQFDLVVTDLDMPKMNGHELLRTIRGDSRLNHLPAIVVSARNRPEDAAAARAAGADAVLEKGLLRDSEFLRIVAGLLPANRARPRA